MVKILTVAHVALFVNMCKSLKGVRTCSDEQSQFPDAEYGDPGQTWDRDWWDLATNASYI